jgi:hypothetical protein
VKETLLGPKNTLGSFFHKKVMLDLLSSYQKSAALSAEVFCLLMIELWHQRFAGSATQD